MATIPSFDMPDEALEALNLTPEEFARELRLVAAAFWYDRGIVSQEIGARIAGLDRWSFMLGLSRWQVDVLQESVEDIRRVLERDAATRGEHLTAHHPVTRGDD